MFLDAVMAGVERRQRVRKGNGLPTSPLCRLAQPGGRGRRTALEPDVPQPSPSVRPRVRPVLWDRLGAPQARHLGPSGLSPVGMDRRPPGWPLSSLSLILSSPCRVESPRALRWTR